jgi:Fe-S-cluster containining protein
MRCLKCGYCCLNYFVTIVVNPETFDPEDIKESDLRTINQLEERCIHLRGDKAGEYSCAIHEYPWFKDTPCGTHGQIERTDSDCRLGAHIISKG